MGIPTEVLAWPVSRAPKRPRCANLRLLPRAGECAEAPGELISRAGGLWVHKQATAWAEGMAHSLCCGSLQDSAHTASALGVSPPCWPPLAPPRRPGTAESALSHREHSTQFCTKSHKHNHCHTALAQLGTSLAIFCGRTQGRYPRTLTRAWTMAARVGREDGEPGLWTSLGRP